jgi:NAD(P)-dependent dehydrogenase (short-subunit alcohol dehydrogenase family)
MQLSKDIAAVVTGGASGLGAATARALAGKGVRVALLDLNAGLGEPLAKELGGVFVKADVTDEASVDAALPRHARRTARSASSSTAPASASPAASPGASRRRGRSCRTTLPSSPR